MDSNDVDDVFIYQTVESLKVADINFVAIDFDRTMISIHTGGRYQGLAEDLLPTVRPVFLKLVPALAEHNIQLAVVTFSVQISLIKKLLKLAYGPLADRIAVRGNGNEESWRLPGMEKDSGKQDHMASAAHELSTNYQVDISRASTLLIDDDHSNICKALNHGVRAVFFRPDSPHDFLQDISKMGETHLARKSRKSS